MKNKRNSKTKVVIQSIICVISGIMLLGCMYYTGKNYCSISILRSQLTNDVSVFCAQDNTLLFSWTRGSYNANYEKFCSTCGEKVEDVGVVSSEDCLKCNIRIDSKYKYCPSCGEEVKRIPLKDWLKEKEFSTFEEYSDYYNAKISNKQLNYIRGSFLCVLSLLLITGSGDISRSISKKLTRRKTKKSRK